MITRWMDEKQASIRSEIEGRLHAPDLVDVHHPSVDSAADVRAAYQPRGLAGVPAGPGGGQSSTAADIIEEGRADIDLTREAAQSMRGQRIQGAVDVQSEVNRGRDHGFRSEEHTSELQSLMRISYAVFCLKKKKRNKDVQ